MNSENDLPHQPDTLQPSPLMKKRGNLVWIDNVIPLLAIPLLIVNLQYINYLYSRPVGFSFSGTSPHLSALLAVDLVAASFYLQKKNTPNWKVIFVLLFMSNLIFFGHMLFWITSPYLGLALVGVFPYFSILSIVDFMVVFIKKHPHGSRAWIISYIALIVVSFALFLSGVFIFQFSAFGLIPGQKGFPAPTPVVETARNPSPAGCWFADCVFIH